MSTIYEIPCVKGFIRMCNDGWLQGWHERNGGNLTYRMTEEDVAACRPFFDETPRAAASRHGLTKPEAKALVKKFGYDSASKIKTKDFDAMLAELGGTEE